MKIAIIIAVIFLCLYLARNIMRYRNECIQSKKNREGRNTASKIYKDLSGEVVPVKKIEFKDPIQSVEEINKSIKKARKSSVKKKPAVKKK